MSYPEQPDQTEPAIARSGQNSLSDLSADPTKWALFLDIDGTLIDLAPTPDGIVIPPDLGRHLRSVSDLLGGALALVTGRALPYADKLFAPESFPIAGLHGSERRRPDGSIDRIEIPEHFAALKAELTAEAAQWPGVLVEDKGAAIATHYRQAPEHQQALDALMQRMLEKVGPSFTLQRGKMVIEIRPSHADKGHALEAFLSEPPFAGRLPIAIGDDVTDEAMFRTVNRLGGRSIRIGDSSTETVAGELIPSAATLRTILASLSAKL